MRKMNCCYNCQKRQAHCHATCEEYKQFSEENAKERKTATSRKVLNTVIPNTFLIHVTKSKGRTVGEISRKEGEIIWHIADFANL